jgi:hypothetical protein
VQPVTVPAEPAARPPQGVPDQPIGRRPTDEAPPRPRPTAQGEERVAQPGDRICGACGEPNDPSRKFCRRCGTSLVEARIVAEPKRPWYRRLFGGGRKAQAQYAAGERKSSMQKGAPRTGGLRGLLKGVGLVRGLLGLVVAIGIFGYVGIPSFQSVVNSALDPVMHGGPTQIIDNLRKLIAPEASQVTPRPGDISASSELDGHEASKIADTFSDTDWQATDKVPELTVKFEVPIDLAWVIVSPGNAGTFADFRRPAALELVFPDGSTKRIELEDVKDPQTFDVSADDIARLVIRVVDARGPESAPISISEIEFFAKG